MTQKGIILAGGAGKRLYPLTQIVCKQLLPVYDKPMIYYPLSTLMLAGIYKILIISTPKDILQIQSLLGNGKHIGIDIEYKIQQEPKGIAEAFIIGEEFINNDSVSLILGDNIFHGNLDFYRRSLRKKTGAHIFGYKVNDPERYGVVEFDKDGKVLSLEEKPLCPKSSYAIPGLYVYDSNIVEICKNLKPSSRGELEITDVNLEYLRRGELFVEELSRGMAWLDTGTQTSLLEASNYIAAIENRQGLKIGCIEEIAYSQNLISKEQLYNLIQDLPNSEYKKYLEKL